VEEAALPIVATLPQDQAPVEEVKPADPKAVERSKM